MTSNHAGPARAIVHASERQNVEALRGSPAVHMYLDCAERARERAQKALTDAERILHRRMERSWMNLAARTAHIEGVDLFLHARQHDRLPPLSQCPECRKAMTVRTIKLDRGGLVYNFQCASCGCQEERSTAA